MHVANLLFQWWHTWFTCKFLMNILI